MNHMDKLKIKHSVKPKKPFKIKIKNTRKTIMDVEANMDTKIEILEDDLIEDVTEKISPTIDTEYEKIVKPKRNIDIHDHRNRVDINRDGVLARLNQFTNNRIVVDITKATKQNHDFKIPIHNVDYKGVQDKPTNFPKKIKQNVIIEEENIDIDSEEEEEEKEKEKEIPEEVTDIVLDKDAPPIIIKKKRGRKVVNKEPGIGTDEATDGATDVATDAAKKKKPGRITKKKYQQLIVGEIEMDPTIKINRKLLINRLPKKEKFVVRTSNYYMNNRKIHIQKLAELFKPYKQEIIENAEKASCKGTSDVDIKLFTHQKIVRDYLNIYTPYRGLLLYHGLGSGKTCTSIAIAEGMKSNRPIILMTPAALKDNFMSEIKKCGDHLYRRNQYWEFVSTIGKPEYVSILSTVLQIPQEFIHKYKGAWLVDASKKEMNYAELETDQKEVLNEQLDLMIRSKYRDVNYNGLNESIMRELTQDSTINPFDNTTVLIDEAHNFVSRIVNNVKNPETISYMLYDYLLKANNVKIVFLTGTPIINYPNELGILFNMLRGYIKRWTFQIHIKQTKRERKINRDEIMKMFDREDFKTFDYVEYSGNNLIITRNPFGFINVTTNGNRGKAGGGGNKKSTFTKKRIVIHENKPSPKKTKSKRPTHKKSASDDIIEPKFIIDKKTHTIQENPKYKSALDDIEPEARIEFYDRIRENPYKGGGIFEDYGGVTLDDSGNISDEDFVKEIKRILNKNQLEVIESGSFYEQLKALPDDAEEFKTTFIDPDQGAVINDNLFKKRIIGLTSYYKSASEKLLPAFVPTEDGGNIHIVPVEMSEYQFSMYEKIRKIEAEQDTLKKQKKQQMINKGKAEDIYSIPSSYRVFSRALCNFAFPTPPGRPMPDGGGFGKKGDEVEPDIDIDVDGVSPEKVAEEKEFASIEDVHGREEPVEYQERIKNALKLLKYDPSKSSEDQYLIKQNLPVYSSKFSKIVENISNPENRGLHLLYSQFRTIEGIGIMKLILEANGYAEFKIRKNESGAWDIVNHEDDVGKPRFVLYTGTEKKEEKEIIRNIYNSTWSAVPSTLTAKLYPISNNNYYGEIIKVFMITSSGAEGINLRNTRFVHIAEPYWHSVRTDQVIGRARRICSHEDLPEEDRNVKVFLYISVFSEEQKTNKNNIELMNRDTSRIDGRPITTDESLYDISVIKGRINDQLLKCIKETSIDCSLYSSNKEENLVCYGYGKVTSNAFGSYPTLAEDLSDRQEENVKKEKLAFKLTKPIDGVVYAINPKTMEAYDLNSYEEAKAGTGELVLVGKVIKEGKGFKFVKL